MSALNKMLKGTGSVSERPVENNGASNLIDFKSETIDSIVPEDFILVNSGTYQDQHHRSWSTPKNSLALKKIVESVRRTASTNVSPATVASAGGLLRVEAQSQGVAVIPNSWGTERGIFLLKICFNLRDGTKEIYFIQGFTDSADFSQTAIAPNLCFHVNNVIALKPIQTRRGGVLARGLSLKKNYQPLAIHDTTLAAHGSEHLLVRPYDVFTRMANSSLASSGYDVKDESGVLRSRNRNLTTSKRLNSIPTVMLPRMVNSFFKSQTSLQDEYEVTSGDIAEDAASAVSERDSVEDSFFEMIRKHSTMASSSFTWGQLQAIAPGIERVRRAATNSGRGVVVKHRGDSDGFGNSKATTQAMSNLQSAFPSLMLECRLTSVTLISTNRTPTRQPETSIRPAIAFDASIMLESVEMLCARFSQEIAPTLVNLDEGQEYTVSINCSYNGDLEVKLDVDGDESYMISPAFCDSIFPPTINARPENAVDVIDRISTICAAISDSMHITQNNIRTKVISDLDTRAPNEAGIRQGDVIGIGAGLSGGNRTRASALNPSEVVKTATPWGGSGGGFGGITPSRTSFGRRGK